MEVYLVPAGPERHELYCEIADDTEVQQETDAPDEETRRGGASRRFFRRLSRQFNEMLAEAERERLQARAATPDAGWLSRVRGRMMRWAAESIAEQRLLWHLRRQSEAHLFYPDDLDDAHAMAILRGQLKRDGDKHQFWLVIDSLGLMASALLTPIPGPNLIAYYFAFRVVGHYFSLRGARQGLHVVHWTAEQSAPLAELRRAMTLEPELRVERVRDVAGRLRLERLASFFERIAVPSG